MRCAKQTQSPEAEMPPAFQYSTIPAFQSDANGAKQTQLAADRPSGPAAGSPVPPRRTIAPNKPNFRQGIRRGKQLVGKELW